MRFLNNLKGYLAEITFNTMLTRISLSVLTVSQFLLYTTKHMGVATVALCIIKQHSEHPTPAPAPETVLPQR